VTYNNSSHSCDDAVANSTTALCLALTTTTTKPPPPLLSSGVYPPPPQPQLCNCLQRATELATSSTSNARLPRPNPSSPRHQPSNARLPSLSPPMRDVGGFSTSSKVMGTDGGIDGGIGQSRADIPCGRPARYVGYIFTTTSR
jgi:hypothetical protein